METSIYYFLKNIQKNEILSNPEYKKKITSGLQLFRTKELTTTGVINDSENVEIDTDKGKKLFNFIVQDLADKISEMLLKIETIHKEANG